VAALLPVNPFLLFAVPWSIAAIVKLRQPEVRRAFRFSGSFADVPSHGVTRDEKPFPDPLAYPVKPALNESRSVVRPIAATAGLAAFWLLAVAAATVIFIQTNHGTVRVEVLDPDAQVMLRCDRDDEIIEIKDYDVTLRVPPGANTLHIKHGDLEFETEQFSVKRGEKVVVRVSRVDGNLEARVGDKLIGSRRLAAPSSDGGTTALAEFDTAERLFTGPNAMGLSITLSADGSQALVGHGSGRVTLWNVATGRQIREFVGPTKPVPRVLFWPDGKHVAASSEDGSICVWDIETSDEVRQFRGHTGRVEHLALSDNGSLLLSGANDYEHNKDNSVRLWNAATGDEIRRFAGDGLYVRDLVFSKDARYAYGSLAGNAAIRQWDVATGDAVHRFTTSESPAISLAISPDGRLVAAGHAALRHDNDYWNDPESCVVRLWDLESRTVVRELHGHSGPVGDVAFTPDGRYLLSVATSEHSESGTFYRSRDDTVRLWEVSTGREIARYHMQERVIQIAVSPDGRSFVTVGVSIRLWRLPQFAPPTQSQELVEIRQFEGHGDRVYCVGSSADGRYVVSASRDQTVRLWDMTTGEQVKQFKADVPLRSVDMSRDGRILAAGGHNQTVTVWDV
jgi:WD40 repeat protein